MSTRQALVAALLFGGCSFFEGQDSDTDPPPPPLDTRLVVTAYAQDCRWDGEDWIGLEAMHITLEHADPLPDRSIPPRGECVNTFSLFAEEALDGGVPLDGLAGQPSWVGVGGSGQLSLVVPGLWHRNVYENQERCGLIEEHVGDGIELDSAAAYGGLKTPAPGELGDIQLDGARFVDRVDPVELGDELRFTWTSTGWQQSFVHVRRSHGGLLKESIVCGTTGLDAFTVDESVWGLATESTLADDVQVYVGFQNVVVQETDDGSARAELITRAVHVLGDPSR
jgi:hypothetical protein